MFENALLFQGLHGVLFPDNMEAAFGVYKVWEGFGFMVAFFANTLLCMHIKLYALLVLLCIGIICYLLLEYMESKRRPSGAPPSEAASSCGSSHLRLHRVSSVPSRRLTF